MKYAQSDMGSCEPIKLIWPADAKNRPNGSIIICFGITPIDVTRHFLGRIDRLDSILKVLTSVTAERAPNLGSYVERYDNDPSERYTRNASLGNMLGLCGLSLPCGFTTAGLLIGLGLYAKPFEETLLLCGARGCKSATTWHTCRPDLTWAI